MPATRSIRLALLVLSTLAFALMPAHGREVPGSARAEAAALATPVPRAAPAVEWAPPLPRPLTVLTPFDPPATAYGAGHLGVDLAARQGEVVRSAGAGTVAFAGSVAGRGVVVVAHPDGVRTEYEPLRVHVRRGAHVVVGTVLGTVDGHHAACAPASCLHWGARRAGAYLDPLDLLLPLGPVRLLPWNG